MDVPRFVPLFTVDEHCFASHLPVSNKINRSVPYMFANSVFVSLGLVPGVGFLPDHLVG